MLYSLDYRLPEDGPAWTIHPLSPMPQDRLFPMIGNILALWPDCEIHIQPAELEPIHRQPRRRRAGTDPAPPGGPSGKKKSCPARPTPNSSQITVPTNRTGYKYSTGPPKRQGGNCHAGKT